MPGDVHATRVRYIKLGEGGGWADECLRSDTLRIGFWTHELFDLCIKGKWNDLAREYEARGRSKSTVTSFVGQVRAVYEDDGATLWVTFHTRRMYWTFVDVRVPPQAMTHGEGSLRKTLPWRGETIAGAPLWMTALPGTLTKTASYPGTSCELGLDVLRRINGEGVPEVQAVERVLEELQHALINAVRLMHWKDFELLIDLLFTTSGWRRQGQVGEDQSTSDIELELPSTGERAFVQIKSSATQMDLEQYRARFGGSTYDRMFFAYHTAQGQIHSADPKITLLGADRLSRMILDAGLVNWLLDKVR